MKIKELTYFTGYAFRTMVLGQRKPIIAGMPLTDVCNLHCKHCVVANVGRGHYNMAKIDKILKHFFSIGVRIIYLQGGEIMTWGDGTQDVNSVIRLAHKIGFFKVAVVTNGTMGIPLDADLVWVSIDGSERIHDLIRGAGTFALIIDNLKATNHRRVSLNMTINRLNAGEVEAVAELARRLPNMHGVSFNFHTPYLRVEELSLPLEERAKVIDRILKLKRQGFPVLNTVGGLKALKSNQWRRPVSMIQLMEKDRIYECCFGREQPGVCQKCGYGVIAELSQIKNWNIPTILESLSLFS